MRRRVWIRIGWVASVGALVLLFLGPPYLAAPRQVVAPDVAPACEARRVAFGDEKMLAQVEPGRVAALAATFALDGSPRDHLSPLRDQVFCTCVASNLSMAVSVQKAEMMAAAARLSGEAPELGPDARELLRSIWRATQTPTFLSCLERRATRLDNASRLRGANWRVAQWLGIVG